MRDTNRRQGRWLTLLIGVGIGLGLGARLGFSAEEPADRASRSSRPTSSTSKAASASGRDAQLERKLDEILSTQQSILQRFDAIMEELRIVKVRCTAT